MNLMVGICKTSYYKKLLAIENNQLKCGDYYSLLFLMCTDDDEQQFN